MGQSGLSQPQRDMEPTVYRMTEKQAGISIQTANPGDAILNGTIIAVFKDVKKLDLCYSKGFGECNRCVRIECPFSGKER